MMMMMMMMMRVGEYAICSGRLQRSPDPLAGFRGGKKKERERGREEGERNGRDRKEGEGREGK